MRVSPTRIRVMRSPMSNNESGDDETAETAANHENDKAVSHESKDEPR